MRSLRAVRSGRSCEKAASPAAPPLCPALPPVGPIGARRLRGARRRVTTSCCRGEPSSPFAAGEGGDRGRRRGIKEEWYLEEERSRHRRPYDFAGAAPLESAGVRRPGSADAASSPLPTGGRRHPQVLPLLLPLPPLLTSQRAEERAEERGERHVGV
jgi:hypothetical protein